MKAIILAGGMGKRLRPVTDYVPKPLIPIRNVPIIEWQIRYLRQFGIDEIIICTGYKADMVENYLTQKDLGVRIRFSVEKTPLGTGGAIKNAIKHVSDKSFFVINGDVITDINLKKLAEKANSVAAIEVRTKYGIMDINADRITAFREKKEISGVWMNAGIYHLEQTISEDLPTVGDIENTVFPRYAKDGKLNTVPFTNVRWYSIDSFKDAEQSAAEITDMIK